LKWSLFGPQISFGEANKLNVYMLSTYCKLKWTEQQRVAKNKRLSNVTSSVKPQGVIKKHN